MLLADHRRRDHVGSADQSYLGELRGQRHCLPAERGAVGIGDAILGAVGGQRLSGIITAGAGLSAAFDARNAPGQIRAYGGGPQFRRRASWKCGPPP